MVCLEPNSLSIFSSDMRKPLSLFTAFVFMVVFFSSSSDELMKTTAQYRYALANVFGSDKYAYGDLYGLAYLPAFKITAQQEAKLDFCGKTRNINLYAICDSYLWFFVKGNADFCGVDKYAFSRWTHGDKMNILLDSNRKNVLLIEVAERNLRYMTDTAAIFSKAAVTVQDTVANTGVNTATVEPSNSDFSVSVFNPLIEQNLQFSLFDYRFFTPFKEMKAQLNYKLFNRSNEGVKVSANGKYLYLAETVDSTQVTSSFNPVSAKEIDKLVYTLNLTYRHYKLLGFDEVYFSVIPNPVTILNTEKYGYNELIPKVQNNETLEMKIIDAYTPFKKSTAQLYQYSDSHWNNNGFHLWTSQVDRELDKIR